MDHDLEKMKLTKSLTKFKSIRPGVAWRLRLLHRLSPRLVKTTLRVRRD